MVKPKELDVSFGVLRIYYSTNYSFGSNLLIGVSIGCFLAGLTKLLPFLYYELLRELKKSLGNNLSTIFWLVGVLFDFGLDDFVGLP